MGTYGYFRDVNFCQNMTSDISAGTGCSADAVGCTFSGSAPGSSVEGDVDWDVWESCGSDLPPGPQRVHAGTEVLARTSGESITPVPLDYAEAIQAYRVLRQDIYEEKMSFGGFRWGKFVSRISSLLERFERLMEKYAGTPIGVSSLGRVIALQRLLLQEKALPPYLNAVAKDPKYASLRPYILDAMASCYVRSGEYTRALNILNTLLATYSDHALAPEVLYRKGLMYKYYLDEPEKAEAIFEEFLSLYPDDRLAFCVQSELAGKLPKELAHASATGESLPSSALQLGSCPNSFNPATTISYRLPEAGQVKLAVYDLRGRLLAVLMDGKQEADPHSVVWNAPHVASGIYFCRLEARSLDGKKSFSAVHKLVLVR